LLKPEAVLVHLVSPTAEHQEEGVDNLVDFVGFDADPMCLDKAREDLGNAVSRAFNLLHRQLPNLDFERMGS